MARRTYNRDKIGRFAGTGGGGRKSKSKKPRKSDLAFQKSGKGGGTSSSGRWNAFKKKEGARRKSATARKGGSFTKTGTFKGSQRKKQAAATRAAKGTGYKRTRKPNKPVSPAVKAQRKAAAQAKKDARINALLKSRNEFADQKASSLIIEFHLPVPGLHHLLPKISTGSKSPSSSIWRFLLGNICA